MLWSGDMHELKQRFKPLDKLSKCKPKTKKAMKTFNWYGCMQFKVLG